MSALLVFENSVWAAIAALGFAILFNVPPRTLAGCAVGGAVAYLSERVSPETASRAQRARRSSPR
jgi:uncharacterized membrane protein YjjB (DUF3815 family)